jgi:tetratricopeptide (TPR) repeat protein
MSEAGLSEATPAVSEAAFEADRRGDRLSAAVALIIALTTVVVALVAYLQGASSTAANDRRLAAEQLSLQALASAQREQQAAQVNYATFARLVEQRTAAGNALLHSLYAEPGSAEEARLTREQARWERLAEATAGLTEIDLEAEFGPGHDPAFPARYFAAAAYESLRLNALQDAANEEAVRLDERAASFTAILAMLAVSLYLLGLTLAVDERWLKYGFLSVGVLLLSFSVGWSAAVMAEPVPVIDERAAEAYAHGRVALHTALDAEDYAEAVAHFDRALELRPGFARAYSDRADAIFLAATPQRTGFASIVPSDALRDARADLERARDLGLESAKSLGSLGFYAFLEGVQAGDRRLLEESIDYTRRAIARDPGEPVYRFNLAVALVAADRPEEARSAYSEALARALYLDDARREPRGEPWIEQDWLAGALTDLEIVLSHRPELAEVVLEMKQHIVGPISAGTLEPLASSPASISELSLTVFPAEAQWQARLEGYEPGRDVVTVQWYHHDADGLGWAVLPEISRTGTPLADTDGRHFQLHSYLAAVLPPACLPPGSYRGEVYLNGRLVGSGETVLPAGTEEAFVARDLTVAFCRPADWQPLEDALPGLIGGTTNPDGSSGAYAVRYAFPRRFEQLDSLSAEIMQITVESFADSFPGVPLHVEQAGTTSGYFMGLADTAWRWYDYGTGYVRAGAGLSEDGAVIVGLVFGPYAWFDGDEPYQLLSSFVAYE